MTPEQHSRISASHLVRRAYVYVRQSTLRQVLENTESTKRQYALRERAIALGYDDYDWMHKDPDLVSLRNHPAFQKLLAKLQPQS